MDHATRDTLIAVAAIVVPVLMVVLTGILSYAIKQTIGRVMDRVESVQSDLAEHKQAVEKKLDGISRFLHWCRESFGLIAGKTDIQFPKSPD